jgi:predicted amidophosphoribosyltransferase
MTETTRCALGGHRVASDECSRCGAAVCRMHYDGEMGLCADCASRVKPDGRRGDTFLY